MNPTKALMMKAVICVVLLSALYCKGENADLVTLPVINVPIDISTDRGAELTGSLRGGLPVRIKLNVGLSASDVIRNYYFDEKGRLQWVSETTITHHWDEKREQLDATRFSKVTSESYRFKPSGEVDYIEAEGGFDAKDAFKKKAAELHRESSRFAEALKQPQQELVYPLTKSAK